MTKEEFCTLRKRLGWSQAEMARRLGKVQQTIADVEQGKRSLPPAWLPKLEKLQKVADLLETV